MDNLLFFGFSWLISDVPNKKKEFENISYLKNFILFKKYIPNIGIIEERVFWTWFYKTIL